MEIPFHQRLFFRQAKNTIMFTFLLSLILSGAQIGYDLWEERLHADENILQILNTQQDSATQAVYFLEEMALKAVVNGLFEYNSIRMVRIVDELGNILVSRERPATKGPFLWVGNLIVNPEKIYTIALLQRMGNKQDWYLGRLDVSVDSYLVAANFLTRARMVILTDITRNILIASMLMFIFYHSLTRPLKSIVQHVAAVNPATPASRLLTAPRGHERDEFYWLIDTTNGLLEGFAKSLSSRYAAEAELKEHRDHLEELITARTAELTLANARLQQEIGERQHTEEILAAERNLLRTLIDVLPDEIYVKDRQHRFLIANSTGLRNLGFQSSEQLLGKTDFDLFPRSMAEKFYAEEETILMSGQSVLNLEVESVDQGKPVWLSLTQVPFRDHQGEIVGLVGVNRDITEQKHKEQALQHAYNDVKHRVDELAMLNRITQTVTSMLDLQSVLKSVSQELVAIFDAKTTSIALLNPERSALTFMADYVNDPTLPNIVGATITLEHNCASAEVVATRKSCVVSQAQTNPRIRSSHYIQRQRQIHCLMIVPLLSRGNVIGTISIGTDQEDRMFTEVEVTLAETIAGQISGAVENARLYGEAQEARIAAETASKAKSSFLANMSHELRTPLNAVIGYTEMLLEDAEEQGYTALVSDLRSVRTAGEHLLTLISDILDLSKIEAGKMELFLETFSVQELLHETMQVIQPLAEKNVNTMTVSYAGTPVTMYADVTKVRQTLFNLLSNACKFTKHGAITLTVSDVLKNGRAWVSFRVSDTGIGMTREQIGQLFQVFTQIDPSTTRQFSGTGLGLVISKRFCQMMGGDITVASEPGKGSTFTIWLPTGVEQAETDAAAVAEIGEPQETRTQRPCQVLVVDDDAQVRHLMQRILTKAGFQVMTAVNGEEGLRLAHETPPDVITLDVMMPGKGGWSMLAELKATPALAAIPVIMLTAVDDQSQGSDLGAAGYLTKPIDREQLLQRLHDICPVIKNRFEY